MEIYSDIPLWTLILWGLFVVAISIFYYRKKSWIAEIANRTRLLLIALRALGLFLLGVLLLGILIQGKDNEVENPLVITLVDNSKSMLNYADSANVKKESKAFVHALQSSSGKKYKNLIFTLGNQLNNADSLKFNYQKTNLSEQLNKVYDNYYGRNIGAVILLSDGNYNKGTSPLMEADKFKNVPFYTLAVGDTIQKIDQLIQSVAVNQIAFLGNKFPVEVSILGNKTPNSSVEVKLMEDGKVMQTKKIKHDKSDYSIVKTTFLLDAKTLGMHEYNVKVDALPNEYNLKNNAKSFFVEVLNNKSKILLVSEGLTPDIGAIKGGLNKKNNLSLKIVRADDLPKTLKPYDLIVWHSPGALHQKAAFQKILEAKKPIWYFITPKTPRSAIADLPLAASIQTSGNTDDVSAAYNQAFTLFDLSPEARKAMEHYPPLRTLYGPIKYKSDYSILAYQKVGDVTKKDPLLYFGKNQNRKFAVTYGTGIWKWRIDDYRENKNHHNFDEWVNKTVQYLIVKENKSKLRIHLASMTTNTEDFIVKAEFYNDSYEPITSPVIHFKMTNSKGKEFTYSFLPQGKEYVLNLGRLPKGKYTWEATTSFNNKAYKKSGEFAIKTMSIEQKDTRANHHLLKQLAVNHNGKFEMLSNYKAILKDLNQRTDIVPVSYSSSIYRQLIDYWWILLLIVFLFIAEWGIRKYLGGY